MQNTVDFSFKKEGWKHRLLIQRAHEILYIRIPKKGERRRVARVQQIEELAIELEAKSVTYGKIRIGTEKYFFIDMQGYENYRKEPINFLHFVFSNYVPVFGAAA